MKFLNMNTTTKNPKVACVLWGPLQYRGRLLKQIAALQEAGIDCRLIYGDRGELTLKREDFNFPIEVIPTSWEGHPMKLFLRQLRFCAKAANSIASSDATHALCFSLQTALAGVLAKRKRPSLKVIFDSNELHIEAFIHPIKKRLWSFVQKYCVPRCDVIMHAEGNRLEYFKKHHDPGERIHFLLENFPYFIPRDEIRTKPERPPVRVLYVGVMGEDRFTREMIDIFRQLAPEYTLDLVGPCPAEFRSELEAKLVAQSAPNIRILPAIRHNEMANLIQSYHVGIALYRNDNLCNYYCAPNKVYDYLMNGVAVVANNYPGLLKVLEEGKVGACVNEIDLDNFRAALGTIVTENRWDNISETVRHQYSWEAQNKGYLELFR
jgi:glycosyltransferase involved in cell wall biosynthesis